MGQHTRPASTRRRAILLTVLGLVLVLGVAAGVQAAIRSVDDSPATSADPQEPGARGQGRRDSAADPAPAVDGFPGQPQKKSGLRPESGLASGLGEDAGDLAAEAQDLIDAEGEEEDEGLTPFSFRVSSYNILGAAHTAPGGNKPSYASGEQRMGAQVAMIRSQGVDLVGFQEFEPPQFRSFMRRTGGAWGVYPAMSAGRGGLRQSIAWRQDTWELADYRTIPIPYFRGNPVPMPVILLTHKETKRQLYVINIHNPASNPRRGNNERWRDVATSRQVSEVRRLKEKAPQVPVILMGDFNEKLEAYCRVTGSGMVAANPGGAAGGCSPPALMGIDWIFGTSDLVFSDYRKLATGRTSDHPMLVASARAE